MEELSYLSPHLALRYILSCRYVSFDSQMVHVFCEKIPNPFAIISIEFARTSYLECVAWAVYITNLYRIENGVPGASRVNGNRYLLSELARRQLQIHS
jgi:hypothetical protein